MPPSEVKAINCLRLMVEGKGVKDDRVQSWVVVAIVYTISICSNPFMSRYDLTHVTASEMVLYLTLKSVFGVELCRDVVFLCAAET